LKQAINEKELSRSFSARRGGAHGCGLVLVCYTRYVNMKPEFFYRKYTFIA